MYTYYILVHTYGTIRRSSCKISYTVHTWRCRSCPWRLLSSFRPSSWCFERLRHHGSKVGSSRLRGLSCCPLWPLQRPRLSRVSRWWSGRLGRPYQGRWWGWPSCRHHWKITQLQRRCLTFAEWRCALQSALHFSCALQLFFVCLHSTFCWGLWQTFVCHCVKKWQHFLDLESDVTHSKQCCSCGVKFCPHAFL